MRRGTATPTASTTTTIAAASGRIATGSSGPSTAICRSIGLPIEQLAGDLLPNPTLDQRIATGFVRSNATTNENGVIEEEVRVQYVKDRADTAGTVFLGLTVGCATCHDHKFDPISQKDHYALEAFFNNTTERIMDNNRPDPPPIVIVPADRDRARWLELEALRKSLRARMAAAHQAPNARFDGWLASRERSAVAGSARRTSELLAVSVDAGSRARAQAGRDLHACRSTPASQRVTNRRGTTVCAR